MRSLRWMATVALLAGLAEAASCQMLRGTVLDAGSGEPVVLAYVGLLAEGRELVVADLADVGGSFTLEAPSAGSYFLYVSRTGYETLMEGLFELGADGSLDLRVGLKPKPVELDPVSVEARRSVSPLERAGFYDRVLTGQGTFLNREDIERGSVELVADVFRNIPRVEIDTRRPLTGFAAMQYPAIVMRRGAEPCAPTLYVDRSVVATGVAGPVRPDEYVRPIDIEAIEVYPRATQVPVEFDPISGCGVIVIWTRVR